MLLTYVIYCQDREIEPWIGEAEGRAIDRVQPPLSILPSVALSPSLSEIWGLC